jgi:hypothetical protein
MKQIVVVALMLMVQTAVVIAVLNAWRPAGNPPSRLEEDTRPAPPYAYALVHIARFQPAILPRRQLEGNAAREEFDAYRSTQAVRLRTREVLNAALNNPAVVKLKIGAQKLDPVAWLESRITTDYAIGPEILRITVSGADPEQLKDLAGAVRTAYLDEVVEKDFPLRFKRLDMLKTLHDEYRSLLDKNRKELKALGNELSVVS